jgi:hypothetical protein
VPRAGGGIRDQEDGCDGQGKMVLIKMKIHSIHHSTNAYEIPKVLETGTRDSFWGW